MPQGQKALFREASIPGWDLPEEEMCLLGCVYCHERFPETARPALFPHYEDL